MDNLFNDLIPASDAATGGLFDDLVPEVPETTFGGQVKEAVKGIIPGAVKFGGSVLQGAAGMQKTGQSNAAGFGRDQMSVMDRIDAGENVPDNEDAVGYKYMTPDQRREVRAQMEQAQSEFNPGTVEDSALYRAGETVMEAGDRILPASPGYEDSIGRTVGEGLGSVAAGAAASVLGGPLVAGATFSLAGTGEAVDRAIKGGATEEQIIAAAQAGIIPGLTDSVPVETLLGRIPVPGGGLIKIPATMLGEALRVGGRIGFQALVEGIQEGGQEFLQNAIEQNIYNPDQGLGEGVGGAAGMGAGVGGVVETLMTPFRRRGARQRETTQEAAPEQENTFDDLVPAQEAVADTERLDSPRLTPEDRASPIPNDIIDDGKAIVDQATGKEPAPIALPAPTEVIEAAPVEAAPQTEPVAEAAVPVPAIQRAILRKAGAVDEDIDAMSSDERMSDVRQAIEGGIAPTQPELDAARTYGAAPVQTEAPALSQPVEQPAPAPVASAPAPQAAPIPRRDIDTDTALTSAGRSVPVTYSVVEAGSLVASQRDEGGINPSYPAEMQPRDRSRGVSQQQIQSISQDINPRLLDKSPRAADGAPIIANDGVVESGNGRVLALRKAYAEGKGEGYRSYLAEQGYPVDGMNQPVLVRVREGEMTPEDRRAFTREANERDTLGMSATEQAVADASSMGESVLSLYRGGDIDQAGNREFVRAFIGGVVNPNDQASMIARDGAMSQQAVRRVQAALLAKAYGDSDLVSSLVESTDTNIRAIGGALMDVAADWAQMRAEAQSGQISGAVDVTTNLLEAVRLVERARRENKKLVDLVGQIDIFSGQAVSGETVALLQLMFRNRQSWTQPAGREKLADALRFYVTEARKTSSGVDLLGEAAPEPQKILATAGRRQYGQDEQQQQLDAPLAAPAARKDDRPQQPERAVEDEPRRDAQDGERTARTGDQVSGEVASKPTPPPVVYHGTSGGGFTNFDPYGGRYGLFGLGGYFTEDPGIAAEYTRKGRGSTPTLYRASISVRNTMDMEARADVGAWEKQFEDYLDIGQLPANATNEQVYREVEETLSQEMIPAYEGAEILQDGIMNMGYDSITHIGGGRHKDSKGIKHRVWIVFDEDQVLSFEEDRRYYQLRPNDGTFRIRENTAGIETEFVLTEAFVEKAADLTKALRRQLDRAGLSDVNVRVSESITAIVNGEAAPADGRYFRNVIDVALDAADPTATLNHESIHAMRKMGLFSENEWSILSRKSKRDWIGRYKIAETYDGFPDWAQVEEGIAHAYADWAGGARMDGIIAKTFRSIKSFIEALGNALTGGGFKSTDSIFEQVSEGEIAARPRDEFGRFTAPNFAVRDTAAFRKWFGDSKVVGADGKPLVVYHGTRGGDFEAFQKSSGKGFYFSPSPRLAGTYAGGSRRADGGSVFPVYLSLQNPKIIGDGVLAPDMRAGRDWDQESLSSAFVNDAQLKALREQGYDGIINYDTREIVAFDPTQIKSVNNRGSFDPSDPRMMFSLTERRPVDTQGIPSVAAVSQSLGARMMDSIKRGRNDGETVGQYSHRKLIDYLHPVRTMIEAQGGTVQDTMNAYLQARLTEDAALARIQRMHDLYVTPMMEALAKGGASLEDFHRYLYARHTPERNRVVGLRNEPDSDLYKAATDHSVKGASGWSTNEAKAALRDLQKDQSKFAALQEAGRMMRTMLDRNLLDQKSAGLISDATHKQLTEQWQHYVPLKAEDGTDGDGAFMPSAGRGFDVRGNEFKGATGRFTEAENVVAWAVSQSERTHLRAQKNAVGKSVLRFLNQYDPKGDSIAKVYWSEGDGFGDIEKAPTVYRRELGKDGKVANRAVPPSTIAADMFSTKVGGKTYYIKFADEKVGLALKKMGVIDLDALSRLARHWTGFQSLINTRANPAFVPINIIRDATTGSIHLLDEGFSAKEAARIVGDIPKAWGALWRNAREKPGKGEWDASLREYIDAGGKIAFEPQKTVQDSLNELRKKMRDLSEGKSKPRAVWDAFIKFVGDLNDAGENGIRLAAYKAAREKGKSVKQAAFIGRDLTVDFKKRGEIGPLMNSWFVFFNASIQGNYNIAARLASSKKVRQAAFTIAASGVLMDLLNRALSGDDEDGESYYSKMVRNEPWKMERQMVLFFGPGESDYFSIPLPYGYNAIYHMGLQASAAAHGDTDPMGAVMETVRVAFDAFNPIGSGGTWLNMVAPTILDPAVDIATNKNFAGIPIAPTRYPNDPRPDSEVSFNSTPDWAKDFASWMNWATGGNEIEPGAIDIHPDTVEHVWGYVSGGIGRFFGQVLDTSTKVATGNTDELEPENVPWVRSFYGRVDDDSRRSEYYNQREEVQSAKSRLDDYKEAAPDQMDDFIDRNRVAVESIKAFDAAEKQLRKIRKAKRAIEAADDLSEEEKKERLKPLDENEISVMNSARRIYAENRARSMDGDR